MNTIPVDRDTWNKLKALGYIPDDAKCEVNIPELGIRVITSDYIPEPDVRRHDHGRPPIRPRR